MSKKNLLFFILLVWLCPNLCKGSPKISINSQTADLGRICSGTQVDVTFKISNKGDETLQISIPSAPCRCIILGEKRISIEPRKTHPVMLKFDSTGYSGKVKKTFTIVTNDPSNEIIKLVIECNVYDLFTIDVKRIPLGYLTPNTKTKKYLNISSQHIDPSIVKIILPKVKQDSLFIDTEPNDNITQTLAKSENTSIHEPNYQALKACKTVRSHEEDGNFKEPYREDAPDNNFVETINSVAKIRQVPIYIYVGTTLGDAVETITLTAKDPLTKLIVKKKVHIGAIVIDPNINAKEIRFGMVSLNASRTKSPQRTLTIVCDDLAVTQIPRFFKYEKKTVTPKSTILSLTLNLNSIKKSGLFEDTLAFCYSSGSKQSFRQIRLSAMVIGR
ncbi:MAG: DUF1573 domain-containing protein [Aliifodinibius sp.]|nr:DUF1573 domain-containing protein [Fodinibius sp.]NIV14377.1 DUF1573 domain-containing protein [Fodinibius sp.]NIY28196.1 DUF1573 domain-containing protein [Fodinibius sp.]